MPSPEPKKPGRPPKPAEEHLDYSFTIRSRKPWRGWLQKAANKTGLSMVGVIDEALAEFAAKHRLPKPPKR